MYRLPQDKIKLRPKHKRILRDTVIDEDGPGTILRDFYSFLAYFQGRNRPLTAGHQLKRKYLPVLNARLTRPIEHGLTHPLQKSFPHIQGLYLLLRASALTYVDLTGRTPILVVDEALDALWQAMNLTERYSTVPCWKPGCCAVTLKSLVKRHIVASWRPKCLSNGPFSSFKSLMRACKSPGIRTWKEAYGTLRAGIIWGCWTCLTWWMCNLHRRSLGKAGWWRG